MSFKEAYARFKRWQLDPFEYDTSIQESHQCNNCGNDFTGNYCPVCSQKENVGPITWKSVAQGIAEVWGLHNRSLPFSVVQLFLRPGYFISDYINGKRQVSFPPVKMLAIISLLGVFVDMMTGAKDIIGVFDSDFDFEGDKMIYLDNAFEWMNAYPDLMSMIMLSYLIIPNYFIFRFAPRNPHHTLPQGFFVQVFCSVIFLVLNMMYDITHMGSFVFVLGAVVLYTTYKQLFGYGVWGTLWRLVSTVTAAIVLAMIMLWLDYYIHLFDAGMQDTGEDVIIFELQTVVAFVAILLGSYWISKPRPPKPKPEPEPIPSEPEAPASESKPAATSEPKPAAAKSGQAPAVPKENPKDN